MTSSLIYKQNSSAAFTHMFCSTVAIYSSTKVTFDSIQIQRIVIFFAAHEFSFVFSAAIYKC